MKKQTHQNLVFWLFSTVILSLGITLAGSLSIEPSSGTIYQSCYQPYKIFANTSGSATEAIDTKFFLENNFEFNADYTGYVTYVSWEMEINSTFPFATWLSGTSTYHYINSHNLSAPVTSGSLLIGTLYLKPHSTLLTWTTGYFNFHFFPGWGITWQNSSDSNIASGYAASIGTGYTQYFDALTEVVNGEYSVTGNTHCPTRPYIEFSNYYQWTYFTTSTGVDRVWTWILWWPDFQNEYNISDTSRNKRTNSTWWTIWTTIGDTKDGYNTGILLTLTGNEPIGMISLAMTDVPNIAGIWPVWEGRFYTRQFRITGDIHTGYVTFDNYIGNIWNTVLSWASRYDNYFNIDAFWVDTTKPLVFTSSISSGLGYEYILLSGQLSTGPSNSTSWRHRSGSMMDDQFAIYEFSGTNKIGFGYGTSTGYNTDLINNYWWEAWSGRSMEKTLFFTQSRSGYILFVDRAGNTWQVYLNLDIDPTIEATIITKPGFRDYAEEFYGLSGLASTWDIRLAYKENGEWIFTHNSQSGDAQVKTNHNGTWTVRMIVPGTGKEYMVVFKGQGMLSVGFTGIWTNDIFDTGTNYFDFVSGSHNVRQHSELFPQLLYLDENYIKVWDISNDSVDKYDFINEFDLQAINNSLTISLTQSINYYDFDINDVINAIEQAIIIEFDNQGGFIHSFNTIDNMYKTGFVPSFLVQ